MQPPSPTRPTLGREEIEILFRQGENFVTVGDFASARMVFRRAAESGDARAALALGATYDPILLTRMGAKGITPDVALAREWYTRAREFGSAEAAGRLQALANAR
jgi:TPR repeat protein